MTTINEAINSLIDSTLTVLSGMYHNDTPRITLTVAQRDQLLAILTDETAETIVKFASDNDLI